MTRKVGILTLTVVAASLLWVLPAGARQSTSQATVVQVSAGAPSEFRFKLSKTKVPHGKVSFVVTNKGSLPHDFKISGKVTPLIQPGKSKTLVVTLTKGKKSYLCTVSGHAAAGMKGVLTVT